MITVSACVVAGSLNFVRVNAKVRHLQIDLREQTAARQKAETEAVGLRQELGATSVALKRATAGREAAIAEKERAEASASEQTKRAEKLSRELGEARHRFTDAQAELSRYQLAGLTPDQIVSAVCQFREMKNSLTAAQAENDRLKKQVKYFGDILHPSGAPVTLPAGLEGKVLVSDPKWHFVILNAGAEKGMRERGELLVSRGDKLVAKIIVASLQKDSAVANVIPGWEFGEIHEGDEVIPANPERGS